MDSKKILLFASIIIGALVLLVVGGILFGRKAVAPTPATISFWGLEDESLWQGIIKKFQESYPYITVEYKQLDKTGYETTLVNSLAEGKGPDVFVLKNTWITKHKEKIYPFPQQAFGITAQDLSKWFSDGIKDDLVLPDGTIVGLPIYIDTPALFYNKDIFNAAGIAEAPRNWDDILRLTKQFSKPTPAGDIIKSGIALGAGLNVLHSFEILSTLIFQNGDLIADRLTRRALLGPQAEQALKFYTSFANSGTTNFSWTSRMPPSINAFADETSVMAIGTSEDTKQVLLKNPHMNLGIAPFPQIATAAHPVVYGSYFFPTVSKQSQSPAAAWQFVLFLTIGDGAKLFLDSTDHAPARRDLIMAGSKNPSQDVFYRQSLIARSWPVPDEPATQRLFIDAIEKVLTRASTPEQSIRQLKEQIELLMQ